jgi:hypothetical protein
MTAEELIAQARSHRKPGPRPQLTPAVLDQLLTDILEVVLDSADCDAHPSSPAAVVARCIATAVANLRDERLN